MVDEDSARTERVEATCAVKEFHDAQPFLIFEMSFLPSLPGVYFGLDLRPGVTHDEAQALADHIERLSPGIFSLTIKAQAQHALSPMVER